MINMLNRDKHVSIVIPVYNQLAYTQGCLESLLNTVTPEAEIILVDNASSDGTDRYLQSVSGVKVITNIENLGFAGACNQGIRSVSGEWIVVMNNDVILSRDWLSELLEAAEKFELDMVTPAIREGELNYDINIYAAELTSRMRHLVRPGQVNGICFMAKRLVFDTIGVFDENFRIGQYEDKDLFLRARKAGFRLGTVGASFIHHFGSITQKSVKGRKEASEYALLNKAYFNKKWRLNWWKRMMMRNTQKIRNLFNSCWEKNRYGHSLMERWIDGRLHYD